jgi:hypothetical protein
MIAGSWIPSNQHRSNSLSPCAVVCRFLLPFVGSKGQDKGNVPHVAKRQTRMRSAARFCRDPQGMLIDLLMSEITYGDFVEPASK